jgi:hypothetical protein
MVIGLTIATILTAYISALTYSNQAFAQSAAGQGAKQFPGGQLPPGFNPGGPMKPGGGGSGIHITFGPCHKIAPGRYLC